MLIVYFLPLILFNIAYAIPVSRHDSKDEQISQILDDSLRIAGNDAQTIDNFLQHLSANETQTAQLSSNESKSSYEKVPFVLVADMDELSYGNGENETYVWKSPSPKGYLLYNMETLEYRFDWKETSPHTGRLAYENRGMELSDLKFFNGKLLSPCDKTGVIYWLTSGKAVPLIINSDGNGSHEKPFKAEWMTIKDDKLYVGGYGKEWTRNDGSIDAYLGPNPLYIKIIDKNWHVDHVDWEAQFNALRAHTGSLYPGYMIHEAVQWSEFHRKWFFLPRKYSKLPYSPRDSETRGANFLLMADEDFQQIEKVEIKSNHTDVARGYSAFQFLPGSMDEIIIALKTVEVTGQPFASFVTVFDIRGQVLYEEQKIAGDYKYEGLEFYDWTKAN
ncbi:apyrase domain-containing protein [Ditylenchus destructor]|nr:apyrase domain-containing protein [Ditylenchus destructor]